MDKIKFAQALTACMNLYGRTITPQVIDLFANAMSAYDTDDVLSALEKHLLDPDVGQYPPKPADLVRRISGGYGDASALAWAKVMKTVRTVGGYESVVFDDPLIHAVIAQLGGWSAMCGMSDKEEPFVGRDFQRLYLGLKQRGETPNYPPVLVGIAEAHNTREHLTNAPPVMIGEPDRAKLVYRGGSDAPTSTRQLLLEALA